MSIPELEEIKFKRLNLRTLQAASEHVLDYQPASRTLREAFYEVLGHLQNNNYDLSFICGHCHAPVDDQIECCWACGSVIEDEPEEKEIDLEELRKRARELRIDPTLPRRQLIIRIEQAERRKRAAKRDIDLAGIEAQRLNERVTALMPDGWKKTRRKQYISYEDAEGNPRFCIFDRGLQIHFRVHDGLLDGHEGIDFYNQEERRRRHYGRANYVYKGDLAKKAEELCQIVIDRYGKKEVTS